jgi:hypothetical protein
VYEKKDRKKCAGEEMCWVIVSKERRGNAEEKMVMS